MIADRVTGNLQRRHCLGRQRGRGRHRRSPSDRPRSQGHPHRRSSLSLANIRQRCGGASQVLRSSGLPEPAIVELGFTIDEASARLSQWFDENPPPTAIQALTNFTTLSVADDAGRARTSHAARHLADRLRRLHLDARPSDALDGDLPAGARNGPGALGDARRADQGRSLARQSTSSCLANSGSASRPARRPTSRPQSRQPRRLPERGAR